MIAKFPQEVSLHQHLPTPLPIEGLTEIKGISMGDHVAQNLYTILLWERCIWGNRLVDLCGTS